MIEINAFRAWRYNLDRVGDLSQVVALPYDKISPEHRTELLDRSPYNVARLIKPSPTDTEMPGMGPYQRAAYFWDRWRAENVIVQDRQPTMTLYTQSGVLPTGEAFRRHTVQVAVTLADYGPETIRRHEQTLAKPLSDRLDLMRATKANFGQIFALYPDERQATLSLIDTVAAQPPLASVADHEGVTHEVRVIADPEWIVAFKEAVEPQYLIIADGHHRYETALKYQAECRAAGGATDAPFNRVLMSIGGMSHPGISILATHRVLRRCPLSEQEVESRLAQAFELEPVADYDALVTATTVGTPHVLGWYTKGGRCFKLTLKPGGWDVHPGAASLAPTEKTLDVALLHRLIIEHLIGFTEQEVREEQVLSYIRVPEDGKRLVDEGHPMLFLLSPTTMEQVQAMTEENRVMPQKSTDFFPKVWSGFSFRDLQST